MTKECWLFLDCQTMTGYPADRCPNYEKCKHNALYSENRVCLVPYDIFIFHDHRELIVFGATEPEHEEGGWAKPCNMPYLWKPGELIVGGLTDRIGASIDEEAKNYGYAVAIHIPYIYYPETKELRVLPSLTKAHQKVGWGRAAWLPYKYDSATKTLTVDMVWGEVENENAIAAGWRSAEVIDPDLPW